MGNDLEEVLLRINILAATMGCGETVTRVVERPTVRWSGHDDIFGTADPDVDRSPIVCSPRTRTDIQRLFSGESLHTRAERRSINMEVLRRRGLSLAKRKADTADDRVGVTLPGTDGLFWRLVPFGPSSLGVALGISFFSCFLEVVKSRVG